RSQRLPVRRKRNAVEITVSVTLERNAVPAGVRVPEMDQAFLITKRQGPAIRRERQRSGSDAARGEVLKGTARPGRGHVPDAQRRLRAGLNDEPTVGR